ncbi:MAG: flagellin [bacterium]|nr:flagellin [bacterium]
MSVEMKRLTMFVNRYMANNVKNMEDSMNKLASGYKITKAGDDPARLAVSEKQRTQYYGLRQALENSLHGLSMMEVAEGGLSEIHNMLQRMRLLSVQAASDTFTSRDRRLIQTEVDSLIEGIDQIASSTIYNGMRVLKDFSAEGSISFHLGANKDEIKSFSIDTVSTQELGVKNVSLETRAGSEEAISSISNAINNLSKTRANIGATIHTLEPSLNPIAYSMEKQVESETQYRDADIAKEMMDFTKNQILLNSSVNIFSKVNDMRRRIVDLIS